MTFLNKIRRSLIHQFKYINCIRIVWWHISAITCQIIMLTCQIFMSSCNNDQGRLYQNCNFHDPQGWGSDLRRYHISYYSEYVLSSTLSIYSTLITIVIRDYDAAFLFHRWFSFLLWWGCWYTNMSPFEKKSV